MIVILCITPTRSAGSVPLAPSPFRPALPGYAYQFPRDHGSHDDFQTEWWYFTGHLDTADGRRYGYELTFFRSALSDRPIRDNPSRWSPKNIFLAHIAMSDLGQGQFHFDEKIGRGAMGLAGADTGRLHVWIGDWSATMEGRTIRLRASTDSLSLDLALEPAKPVAIHGRGGISRKGAGRGQASHYYSVTRITTSGTIRVGPVEKDVVGTSWMDHEFGSSRLSPDQVGWDWFSVQLDDGREIMLYRIRKDGDRTDPASSGSLISKEGIVNPIEHDRFQIAATGSWKSRASGADYPSGWTIGLDDAKIVLTLSPDLLDQELRTGKSTGVTYWEGSVTVRGSDHGKPVRGTGFVELTGYAGRFEQEM